MIAGTVAEIGIADATDGAAVGRVAGTSRNAMAAMLEETMAGATSEGMTAHSVADRAFAAVKPTVVADSMAEGALTGADTAKRQFC